MHLASGSRRLLVPLVGGAIAVAMALTLSVPAHADTTDPTDPTVPTTSPALDAWLNDLAVSDNKASQQDVLAQEDLETASGVSKKDVTTAGERLEGYRGSALLWTANWFEWYWNLKKVTSSKAWQTVGFVFPNTAKADGVSRTAVTTTKHSWRAQDTVGAGVVTPWGNVNIYQNDWLGYAVLKIGGLDTYTD